MFRNNAPQDGDSTPQHGSNLTWWRRIADAVRWPFYPAELWICLTQKCQRMSVGSYHYLVSFLQQLLNEWNAACGMSQPPVERAHQYLTTNIFGPGLHTCKCSVIPFFLQQIGMITILNKYSYLLNEFSGGQLSYFNNLCTYVVIL